MAFSDTPTISNQTGNQMFASYNYAKLFLYDNKFETKKFVNTTGAIVTLQRGMLWGTILASSPNGLQQVSTATDGTEMPRGVIANDYTVAIGATIDVRICVGGKVAIAGIIFGGADTINTAVRTVSTGGGAIGDLLKEKTWIQLVAGNEQTFADNT